MGGGKRNEISEEGRYEKKGKDCVIYLRAADFLAWRFPGCIMPRRSREMLEVVEYLIDCEKAKKKGRKRDKDASARFLID